MSAIAQYQCIIIPLAIWLALIIFVVVREYGVVRKLRKTGILTDAKVIDNEEIWVPRGGAQYTITYEFRPEYSDTAFRRMQVVPYESYYLLKGYDRVKVRYLPDNPKVSRLAEVHPENYALLQVTGLIIGFVLGLIGFIILLLLTQRA
ncbi:MAG: DUF3592 domain-containing protein [Anaerolineae bacterium]|nr:DUF3592 domain-containing protein [Anaerolineae bacterium]